MSSLIVSLDEAKAALNLDDPTDLSDDDELTQFIGAIQGVVESLVGPTTPTDLVEYYDGGRAEIYLTSRPIVEVVAVTEYTPTPQALAPEPLGTDPFTSFGFRVGKNSTVIRTSGGSPSCFASGTENVEVTYTAGRATVPENVKRAALNLIRVHYGPQRVFQDPGAFNSTVIMGFYVPSSVLELLSPQRQVMA